jgi:hypothetical protein
MPVPSHQPVVAPSRSGGSFYDMSSGAEIWATSPRSEPRSNGSVHLDYASIVYVVTSELSYFWR